MDAEFKDILTKLITSVVIGLIIGGEREYRSKSAGLRTIILICLGATIFTILSMKIEDVTGTSRVAANIVTGIGFLGAGAIMRDGLTVSGLTTASTIWVAAALGMAVGLGEYTIAVSAMFIVFVVLTAFHILQERIFSIVKKTIELHLTVSGGDDEIIAIEEIMKELGLRFLRKKSIRRGNDLVYHYEVMGRDRVIQALIDKLKVRNEVTSFDY